MRKAELIALLRDSQPRRPLQSVPGRAEPGPSPQEMDIFQQQETSKSRPQVKSKLNDWYDWLVNHVVKTIGDGASRAFKT